MPYSENVNDLLATCASNMDDELLLKTAAIVIIEIAKRSGKPAKIFCEADPYKKNYTAIIATPGPKGFPGITPKGLPDITW